MISRGLDTEDFLWALDHSRRRYLVRVARHSDLTHLSNKCPLNKITIVRLHNGIDMVVLPHELDKHSEKWINTDAYAEFRLKVLEHRHCRRAQRGH